MKRGKKKEETTFVSLKNDQFVYLLDELGRLENQLAVTHIRISGLLNNLYEWVGEMSQEERNEKK